MLTRKQKSILVIHLIYNAGNFNNSHGNSVNCNIYQSGNKNVIGYSGKGVLFNISSDQVYENPY